MWNYLSLDMELSKEFEENVSSVALHPTGLNILAGFTDKLRSVQSGAARHSQGFEDKNLGSSPGLPWQ